MATRLFFRDEAHSLTGTLPSTEQSTATATWTATGATTLKTLSTVKGGAQVNHPGTSGASTATQSGLLGRFVSQPLAGSKTVGGGSILMNVAESEGNLASNFWINAMHVFVWRPSTNALVGTVRDSGGASLGGTEPTSASSVQVTHITGITSSAVSAQTGDVVVVEVWSRFTQSMGSNYASTFYFGGTTENTTENAVVTNHASFVELAENLVFQQTHALAGTLAAAVTGSAAPSHVPLSVEMVGVASGISSFTMPNGVATGDVAIALAFRDGSTTPPSLPSGWTDLGTQTNTTSSARLAAYPAVGPLSWTQRTSSFSASDIFRVAYGGGLWVAVGHSGKLATSTDGETWTQQTSSFGSDSILGVAYGNGLWVATGGNGKLATSTDGETWTQRTSSFGTDHVELAAYGGSLWVAVGRSGKLATSSDGISWTQQTSSFGATSIYAIAYGGGLWVAAGSSGKLATSSDGAAWTQQTSSFGADLILAVTYGSSLWAAVSASGKLATSSNGTAWTQQTSSFGTDDIYSIAYGGGLWVAAGSSGKLATSSNGSTWTQQDSSFGSSTIRGSAYNAGLWVAVGAAGKLANYTYIDTGFTNATAVVCNVYRGLDVSDPIGVTASTTGAGTTVTLPAVANAATSFVAGFAGHRSADVTFPDSPTGLRLRTSFSDATNEAASYDSGGAVP
jgi:hypothetical protein